MPEEEVRKIEIAYPRPFSAPPRLEASSVRVMTAAGADPRPD